jgi:hypothetical protein
VSKYIKQKIVSDKIIEGKRSFYMCECSICGSIRKVRSDNINKIKTCHPCHHQFKRPQQPSSDFHWCNKCKNWKLKFDFNFRKDGTSRNCKKCEDQYRRSNLHRINEYSKLNRKKNIEKYLLYSARSRAKQYGLQINIDIKDIVIPKYCPVLGIKISVDGNKNNSPSLDKIYPQLGYTKGNVRVISWRANWIKNNSTFEEIEKLYKDSKNLKSMK